MFSTCNHWSQVSSPPVFIHIGMHFLLLGPGVLQIQSTHCSQHLSCTLNCCAPSPLHSHLTMWIQHLSTWWPSLSIGTLAHAVVGVGLGSIMYSLNNQAATRCSCLFFYQDYCLKPLWQCNTLFGSAFTRTSDQIYHQLLWELFRTGCGDKSEYDYTDWAKDSWGK